MACNFVEQAGPRYAYKGQKIGQGRDNSREFLRENPALAIEIENKVRESLGIPPVQAAQGGAEPEKAAKPEKADKAEKPVKAMADKAPLAPLPPAAPIES